MPVRFPKIRLTVTEHKGYCYHDYAVGQQFIFDDFTHPPKNFCLGIAQSMFPAMYALTFGARFPYRENSASIEAACPDFGKLKFLCELLDENGNVVVAPAVKNIRPDDVRLSVSVEELLPNGQCTCGLKPGDKFEFKGMKTPEGFCATAYATMYPCILALCHGASFFHMKPPNQISTVVCPRGSFRFKVERIEKE